MGSLSWDGHKCCPSRRTQSSYKTLQRQLGLDFYVAFPFLVELYEARGLQRYLRTRRRVRVARSRRRWGKSQHRSSDFILALIILLQFDVYLFSGFLIL